MVERYSHAIPPRDPSALPNPLHKSAIVQLPFAHKSAFRASGENTTTDLSARRCWCTVWAERESNPHSQRRLIYSQRSSPPARSAQARGREPTLRAFAAGLHPGDNQGMDDRSLRVAVLLAAHIIFLSAAALRIVRGQREH